MKPTIILTALMLAGLVGVSPAQAQEDLVDELINGDHRPCLSGLYVTYEACKDVPQDWANSILYGNDRPCLSGLYVTVPACRDYPAQLTWAVVNQVLYGNDRPCLSGLYVSIPACRGVPGEWVSHVLNGNERPCLSGLYVTVPACMATVCGLVQPERIMIGGVGDFTVALMDDDLQIALDGVNC